MRAGRARDVRGVPTPQGVLQLRAAMSNGEEYSRLRERGWPRRALTETLGLARTGRRQSEHQPIFRLREAENGSRSEQRGGWLQIAGPWQQREQRRDSHVRWACHLVIEHQIYFKIVLHLRRPISKAKKDMGWEI